MTPIYSCPIHGSCASAKSGSGVHRCDATQSCSLYATPPLYGPCRAGIMRRHAASVGCRRNERCRARHTASWSPFTGSSGCLAAARRQTDSVDSVLLPALDVVPGHDLSATNYALRPLSGHSDVGTAEKADVDGVFYTANSQHPETCGHVGQLLFATSWGRENDINKSSYDLRQSTGYVDDCSGQQSTLSDAASAGNDRGQPTLLVDFHC